MPPLLLKESTLEGPNHLESGFRVTLADYKTILGLKVFQSLGAAVLPETILLKPTQFVRSTLGRGQRLIVDSLAGAAG